MKKIYFALAILVIGTISMAYLYFSNLKNSTNASELSLNAVTEKCAVIFTYDSENSFYDIIDGQQLFKNVLGLNKWKILQSLQQIIKKNEFQQAINGNRIYVGFLPGEKDSIDFLIATQLTDNDNLIKNINKLKEIKTKGETFQVNFGDSAQCFLYFKDNLLLLSNNYKTLKLANPLEGNKFGDFLKNNNRFNKNTLANVYIDFNKVSGLIKKIVTTPINGELSVFNKQDAYAALSYNFSAEKLLLNGYTELNKADNFYHLFIDEKEQKIIIDQLLPENTANYTLYIINNYKNWKVKLDLLRKDDSALENTSKDINRINQKYGLNIDQIFPLHFKQQLITFQLKTGEKFGAIAIDNGDKVEQLLMDLTSEYAPEIRIFKESNLLYAYFGEPFKKFERPFFTIIDNYMVFANNASSIQSFLNHYQNNRLLTKTERYISFNNQLSSSATLCFYLDNNNSNDIFGKNLSKSYWQQYKSFEGLKDFNAFCYQLSADNGKFLTNMLLLKNTRDTTSAIRPY